MPRKRKSQKFWTNADLDLVLQMLRRADFEKWFNRGHFDEWISGVEDAPSKDDILKELNELLGGM